MAENEIIVSQTEAVVVRDHSADMSMAEFASWMSNEFGNRNISKILELAAFMLCCDVISQDIAKSTLRLRERLSNGTSKVVLPTKHEAAALLATEPNRRHTWYEFTEMLVLWKCITQNAYAGAIRRNDGTTEELIPFQSGRIQETIEGRDVFYQVTASTMQEQALLGSSMRVFPERDMIHVRGRMLDGMDGYSTLVAGRKTLETSQAVEEFRNNLFTEEGQLRGVFLKEGVMNEEAFSRMRQQFKTLMTKFRKLTEPIVLEDGIEFKSISSNPAEMELTEQFQSQVNEQCRLLRVPPHKVFQMDGIKYENLETSEKMYVGDTLLPVATQFESRLGKVLLQGKDRLRFFFQYDRSEMTLRDTKAETERVMRAVERGVLTIDEARAVLGYNPLPNKAGETRTIPANMNVVDDKNEIILGGSAEVEAPVDEITDETDETKAVKPTLRLVTAK